MKKIVLMILVITLGFRTSLALDINDIDILLVDNLDAELTMNGVYKKCIVTSYKYEKSKFHKHKTLSFEYDTSGHLIRKISFLKDTKDTFMILNLEYNRNWKIEKATTYTPNGCIIFKSILKYDERKNLIENALFKKDTILWHRKIYKYDIHNNMIETLVIDCINPDSLPGPLKRTIYKYDENSKIIETTVIDCQAHDTLPGPYTKTYKYKYDENRNVIENVEFRLNSPYVKKTIFKIRYDENQNKIEELSQVESTSFLNVFSNDQKTTYTYDKSGRKTEEKLFYWQKNSWDFIYQHTYKYDKYGNFKEEIIYDEFNKPETKTVYKYSK